MIFKKTPLKDVILIEQDVYEDSRGRFARLWSRDEFAENGIEMESIESNLSVTTHSGTLRGMHYQIAPFAQAKLVMCLRGSIYDVVIDLRPESPTYRAWYGMILDSASGLCLYVPKGFAHGFLTREAKSEVLYQMSDRYSPDDACGVRWNDAAFEIAWPADVLHINTRDNSYPDFDVTSKSSKAINP